MEKILNVAKYIFEKYNSISNEKVDEMKLHKLLYFSQRESLALTNEPLFNESFRGWKYGPVSCDVRMNYTNDGILNGDSSQVSDSTKYIVNNVILEYGIYSSWKLSEISHEEVSWKNSRKGLSAQDHGNNELLLDDIRKDASKVRPYDHIWDMYYDEFEDAEVTE